MFIEKIETNSKNGFLVLVVLKQISLKIKVFLVADFLSIHHTSSTEHSKTSIICGVLQVLRAYMPLAFVTVTSLVRLALLVMFGQGSECFLL
jgi:hypothetical protein